MTTLFGLSIDPALPPLLAIILCMLLVALAAVSYWRAMRDQAFVAGLLLLGRCALVVGLLALLLNPTRPARSTPADARPPLWVMLDTSRSMHTADVSSRPRIEIATHALRDSPLAQQLEQAYDVRWYGLGERYLPLTPDDVATAASDAHAAGRQSNLALHMSKAILEMNLASQRADQPGSMLLITDGRDTQGGNLAAVGRVARDLGITIHTVATGRPRYLRDVSVSAIPLQPDVFKNETVSVAATIRQVGFDGRSVRVRLVEYKGDQAIVHEQKQVAFTSASHDLQLQMRAAEPGSHALAVEVQAFDDEPVTANNRQPVVVNVRDRPAHILMIEGEPDFDSRSLAQAIRNDPRFELTRIIRLTPAKVQLLTTSKEPIEGDPLDQIPQSAEAFARYDAVILGSHVDRLFNAIVADEVVKYVNQGGSVMLSHAADLATIRSAAGPLATLQPARIAGGSASTNVATLRVTAAGARHPALAAIASEPGDVDASQRLRSPRVAPLAGSVTLLQAVYDEAANPSPVLVTAQAGSGRIAAMYGSEWWRWRLRPPGQSGARQWHDTMWQDLLRWLVSGDNAASSSRITLDVEPAVTRIGQPVQITARYRFAPGNQTPPAVTITRENGSTDNITMQLLSGRSATYRGVFTPMTPGRYIASAAAPQSDELRASAMMVAVDDAAELLQSQPDQQSLKQLADETLGNALILDDADDAPRIGDLLPLNRAAASQQRESDEQAAGLRWWVMLVALAWLGGEWLIRRRYGWA